MKNHKNRSLLPPSRKYIIEDRITKWLIVPYKMILCCPRMSGRPVTRSRASTSQTAAGPGLHDVSRYLDTITSSSSHTLTRRSVSDRRELVETLKSFIERRIKMVASDRITGHSRLVVSDEYVQGCERVMMKYLVSLIRQLTISSLHRAEQLRPDQSTVNGEDTLMEETPVRSTANEEWLLYKEDCATYFVRTLKNAKEAASLETPTQPQAAPVFNQSEYASHAAEEDKRLMITAQSVRRIGLRDLVAVLPCVQMPVVLERNLVNFAAFHEVSTEYRARGYASSSPLISFSQTPNNV
jgi:hypothetical protein